MMQIGLCPFYSYLHPPTVCWISNSLNEHLNLLTRCLRLAPLKTDLGKHFMSVLRNDSCKMRANNWHTFEKMFWCFSPREWITFSCYSSDVELEKSVCFILWCQPCNIMGSPVPLSYKQVFDTWTAFLVWSFALNKPTKKVF